MLRHLAALAAFEDEVKCVDVIHTNQTLSPDRLCNIVSNTTDCFFEDGFISYLPLIYCGFQGAQPVGVILMFLWLIVMLIGLATTADVFFGPCLIVMADTMRLSENVAGVTLLALGNGAPDIFSAISAIANIKGDDAGLAFGALLGAGMFVTSVTAGAIALVKPFNSMTRPLLKDIVFYLFTIFWTFIIMFKQEITVFESVGFIVVYAIYVIITVASRAFASKGIGGATKRAAVEEAVKGKSVSINDTDRPRRYSEISQNLSRASNIRGHTNPAFDDIPMEQLVSGSRRHDHDHVTDADAGYDTSLDFPGGLRRAAETDGEVKKPRSRRFQELDIHSSPKTSNASRKSSRLDERMKRVSRVHRHMAATETRKTSTAADAVVSGRKDSTANRKTSTTSFTGVDRRANYLARWMMAHGNLEDVEHRGRTPSMVSRERADSMSRSRSNSLRRRRSSSGRKRAESVAAAPQRQDGVDGGMGFRREGYKLSGGLGMGAPMAYFNRKKSREEQHQQQEQQQKQQQQEEIKKRRAVSVDEFGQRSLYRIESVDEQLDDDTLDRLNQLNQMALDEAKDTGRDRAPSREIKDGQQQKTSTAAAGSDEQDGKGEQEDDEDEEDGNPLKEFAYSLVPVDLDEFPEMTWYNKVYEIVKAPVLFCLLLTTPLVDYDQPMNGWSRILNSIHCLTSLTFICVAFKGWEWTFKINDFHFPIIAIVAIVGLILGIVVFFTSSHFTPPKYHPAFAFVGFLTAIVWIYTFANEVVNVLESAGVLFKISNTILGLTVLAWANSIGDVISNTVLARQGFPRVAISACFGGPLFNLLLGVGIPFTIKLIQTEGARMTIGITTVQLVLVTFVALSLIVTMVYVTITNYKVNKLLGILLILLYVVFLVIALLAETGVLDIF